MRRPFAAFGVRFVDFWGDRSKQLHWLDPFARWKRVWMVALLFALGCGGATGTGDGAGPNADSGPGPSGDKRLTVAVIPKSTGGEFWETVERGAQEAGEALGVDVRWEGPLTETEIAAQNQIIENMINLGVAGIALAPLNPKAQQKSAEAAVDAGIPLVVFDSDLDGDAYVSFVATDNIAGGQMGARRMAEKLGDSGRVLVLKYVQATASTENRAQGFIETAKEAGLEIVGDPYPEDGTVAGCKKTAVNVLEGYVHDNELALDGIFTCNLTTALGLQSALSDLRKSGVGMKVNAIGFDSSPKLVEAIRNKEFDALVVQNPHRMGYLAVETLVKHLRKEPIEARIDTGAELVTLDRLESEPALRELVGE